MSKSHCVCAAVHPGPCSSSEAREAGYFAKVQYYELQSLEGKVLTLLDAVINDKEQKKATKDLFRQQFWFQWVQNLDGGTNPPIGMPIEEK